MSDPRLADLHAAHQQFLSLVQTVRPELLRYCVRMTGSVIDGEDVVQETMAQAFYQLSQLRELPSLRSWLFRIAHHRAVNYVVARRRRAADLPLDDSQEALAGAAGADEVLERSEAVGGAIGRFLALPTTQRACVIFKDVLDCTLEDIAAALEMTVPAVKAALHRGRSRLRELAGAPQTAPPPFTPELVRYAELFNARDWDGVRAMLAEDVRLEVVAREKRTGAASMDKYFGNYSRRDDWLLSPAWMDGHEVLAARRNAADERPSYAIEVAFEQGRVTSVRDFAHVPHVFVEATFA